MGPIEPQFSLAFSNRVMLNGIWLIGFVGALHCFHGGVFEELRSLISGLEPWVCELWVILSQAWSLWWVAFMRICHHMDLE